jgi:hypothetical protein
LATTLAGSAFGSRRRGSQGTITGGVLPEATGVTATTTVLFAAANKARILLAMAESLLPIFSIFLKKLSPACLIHKKLQNSIKEKYAEQVSKTYGNLLEKFNQNLRILHSIINGGFFRLHFQN